MKNKLIPRRDFLKLGGQSALFAALGGSALAKLLQSNPSQAAPALPQTNSVRLSPPARPKNLATQLRLAATDGYVSFPGRRFADDNPLYVFGFVQANLTDSVGEVTLAHKGKVQMPAPIIAVTEGDEVVVTLTNVGLETRPDLDDSHSIHWHGFRNPNAVFDGVPEVSISVPAARNFPYFYKPHHSGTYMYHCHFEDTEHVQMGMDGIVFVRPLLGSHYVYNDPSTAFDREYTLLLNEIDTRPHDNLAAVQEFVWSDFKANYWVINGRAYPDTLVKDSEITPGHELAHQPISSLIQANPGERILLRMSHLGYEQQTMQLSGIRMEVIGHDATPLGGQTYQTNLIYIGPGEARDILFTAPNYSASLPGGSDTIGAYNVYWLKNRNYQRLVNGDEPGLGGMMTQVRVYQNSPLGPQTHPNQTF